MTRRVDVALRPSLAGPLDDRVCVVIDALRASSSIVAMLGMGEDVDFCAQLDGSAVVPVPRREGDDLVIRAAWPATP